MSLGVVRVGILNYCLQPGPMCVPFSDVHELVRNKLYSKRIRHDKFDYCVGRGRGRGDERENHSRFTLEIYIAVKVSLVHFSKLTLNILILFYS